MENRAVFDNSGKKPQSLQNKTVFEKSSQKEQAQFSKSFPKEVRRQERAHREEVKVQKAFGKLSLEPKKAKRS
jgi:hypothetical protein